MESRSFWGCRLPDSLLSPLVAALIIMPAMFAYGLDPASGPPLLFITILEVFLHMPCGRIIAILFFSGVSFASVGSHDSIWVLYMMLNLILHPDELSLVKKRVYKSQYILLHLQWVCCIESTHLRVL